MEKPLKSHTNLAIVSVNYIIAKMTPVKGAAPPTAHPASPSEGATRTLPLTVEFETGNPDVGPLVRGSLTLGDKWDECDTIVIEGVPGIMTSADFCVFMRPHMELLKHIRLLRPVSERNRYMVAARLRPEFSASKLASSLIGRSYLQGLVSETCRVRPIEDVQQHNLDARDLFEVDAETDASCAVCLERLESDGQALVTTLCNHSLHAACLAQCELNQCPVCRHTHELTPEASACMSCSEVHDVWMCVVCAYVGCGVYKNKHAYEHFLETNHPFAMNLNELVFWSGERVPANSVWDYISERFVDRLLTADDGKVVELGSATSSSSSAGSSMRKSCVAPDARAPNDNNDHAFEAAIAESRLYHAISEQRLQEERLRTEHAAHVEKLEKRLEKAEKDYASARQARNDAIHDRKSALKRLDAAEKQAEQLREKNLFLQDLNDSLLQDQEGWKKRVNAISEVARSAREERDSLKEQLRDVLMHLQTQATITASSQSSEQCRGDAGIAASELAGADVLRVGPSPRERLAVKLRRRSSNR